MSNDNFDGGSGEKTALGAGGKRPKMTDHKHCGLWGMRFSRLAVLLSMVFGLCFGASATAEKTSRKVVRIPALALDRVMVLDDDGHPVSGYAYDYIQMIGAYSGWDVRYIPCDNFADCVEKLLAGEVDLLYDVSYTPERAKAILYPDEPMGSEYYYLYVTERNAAISPGDYAALNGKTVGVTTGTVQVDLLREWCRKKQVDLRLVEYRTIQEKEDALYAGKIDLDLEVSVMAKPDFSAVEKIGSSGYYLVANRENPDLIEDINHAVSRILNNDLYYFSRLQDRHFSDTVLSRNLTREEKSFLAEHRVLRIGYLDNYLPLCARGADGEPYGAGIEAIESIFEKLDLTDKLKVEYVCYEDQQDGYRAVESGAIDLMFPAYISSSLQQDYHIIGGKVFATLPSDLAYLGDFGDGSGKKIGVNRSNLMQYYYSKDAYPHAEIVLFDDIRSCLNGLLNKSADATFLNGLRTEALLRPIQYHAIQVLRAKGFEFRMAYAEDNIGLMLLMDRGLSMLDPGFFDKAIYSYASQVNFYNPMDFLREHLLSFVITFTILVALLAALIGYRISNRRLEVINRELKEYSATIEKQHQQLENKQQELQNALLLAQAANRAKTTFLSNMSHDIRTPMNAIIGFTTLASGHIDDREHVKEYLDIIAHSSEHLLSLINDVLEMSRIESGKVTLNEKPESLTEIMRALNDIVRADVQAKQHDFKIDTTEIRDDVVYCDKLRLNRVLLNLVSNAIKYTHPGGKISLRVSEKPAAEPGCGTFEFRCRDNGIGISEEYAKTIFEPFTREENTTISGIQGTGLGMPITKNLVELMGGEITVSSKKGEGSEFVVTVEFKIADRPGDASTSAAAEPDLSDAAFSGKKVLMVDDSKLNLKIGVLLLQEQGMIVDTASDGQMAVDMIREKGAEAYDFILMDVQMPVMGGYEATALIRKLPGGDKLKIIAFSANAFEEDREKSLKSGMDAHLSKPLKIDVLLRELKKLLV